MWKVYLAGQSKKFYNIFRWTQARNGCQEIISYASIHGTQSGHQNGEMDDY